MIKTATPSKASVMVPVRSCPPPDVEGMLVEVVVVN